MQNKKSSSLPPFQSLLELQGEFLGDLKGQGRSLNTLKNYKTDLDCFNQYLQKNQKNLEIGRIRISEITNYGDYLQTKYKSDNSRRRRVQALRRFFDFLVVKNILGSNPVKKIAVSPKFLDIPRPTPFSHIKTLWEYLLKETYKDEGLNPLLARRSQISILLVYGAGLKVSDLIDLREDRLFLKGKPRVLIDHPKRDPYSVPLPEIFPTIYEEYKKSLDQVKRSSELEFDQVLFNANPYKIKRGGLSSRGLELVFEEFRKKLMIDITPKSLRQACIFKWIQEGHTDSLIKEWMGVAPNYSLKLYKEHSEKFVFSDQFLGEIYKSYREKPPL